MHQTHLFISSAYFCVLRLRESNLPATDLRQAIYFDILLKDVNAYFVCHSVRPSLPSRPEPPKHLLDSQETFVNFKISFE